VLRESAQQRPADRHEQRGRDTFAAYIADDKAEMFGVKQEEIEEIATHFLGGNHSGVKLEVLAIGKSGELVRQNGLLNLGRMRQFLRAQFLSLFDLDEPGVFDANGRHVSHDREEVEIFGGEFLNEPGRIEIDEAADAVFGLERHGQHAADLLRHDAFAGSQRLMPQRIANQERTPLFQNQVTHAGADPKPGALGSADAEFAALLEGHQDSSRGFHGFH
jgi:hypothetical protein